MSTISPKRGVSCLKVSSTKDVYQPLSFWEYHVLTILAFCCTAPFSTEPIAKLSKRSRWTMRIAMGSGWSSGPTVILDSKGRYKIHVKNRESCAGKLEREHMERVAKDVRLIFETNWVAPTQRSDWVTGDGLVIDISLWRHSKAKRGSKEYHYRVGDNFVDLGRGWRALGHYMYDASKVYEERCIASDSQRKDAD